jgi:hypothetical protein
MRFRNTEEKWENLGNLWQTVRSVQESSSCCCCLLWAEGCISGCGRLSGAPPGQHRGSSPATARLLVFTTQILKLCINSFQKCWGLLVMQRYLARSIF